MSANPDTVPYERDAADVAKSGKAVHDITGLQRMAKRVDELFGSLPTVHAHAKSKEEELSYRRIQILREMILMDLARCAQSLLAAIYESNRTLSVAERVHIVIVRTVMNAANDAWLEPTESPWKNVFNDKKALQKILESVKSKQAESAR